MSKNNDERIVTKDTIRTIARNAMQTGREHALAQIADFAGHVSDGLSSSFTKNPGSHSQRQEAMGALKAHAWISATAEALQSQETLDADQIIEQIIADHDAANENKRLKGIA